MNLQNTIAHASSCVSRGEYAAARQYTNAASQVLADLRSQESLNNHLESLCSQLEVTLRAIRSTNGELPFRGVSMKKLDEAAQVLSSLCSDDFSNIEVAHEMVSSVESSLRDLAAGRYDNYDDARDEIVETITMTLDEVASLVPDVDVAGVFEPSFA